MLGKSDGCEVRFDNSIAVSDERVDVLFWGQYNDTAGVLIPTAVYDTSQMRKLGSTRCLATARTSDRLISADSASWAMI